MFDYTVDSFFDRGDKQKFDSQLDQILSRSIATQGAINFSLEDTGNIAVTVTETYPEQKIIYIEGQVPVSMAHISDYEPTENILLPFLVDFAAISIPHNLIFSYSRNNYCFGEFLVRNLVKNLILRSPLRIKIHKNVSSYGDIWKRLLSVYYWHLDRFFLQGMEERPSKELVFANCITPIFESKNVRFERDVQVLRTLFQSGIANGRDSSMIHDLITCRDKVMHACYP